MTNIIEFPNLHENNAAMNDGLRDQEITAFVIPFPVCALDEEAEGDDTTSFVEFLDAHPEVMSWITEFFLPRFHREQTVYLDDFGMKVVNELIWGFRSVALNNSNKSMTE
nr:hypothetical protein [uncultured Cohaesibacter sp.]